VRNMFTEQVLVLLVPKSKSRETSNISHFDLSPSNMLRRAEQQQQLLLLYKTFRFFCCDKENGRILSS